MFSDEELKDIRENDPLRLGDEILSIRDVCLSDKSVKKDEPQSESWLSSAERNDLDLPRSLFREGLFGLDDPNIPPLFASDAGVTNAGQGLAANEDMVRSGSKFSVQSIDSHLISIPLEDKKLATKCSKNSAASQFHYVKFVSRQGRTIKIWECGVCGREFQHQYTLMRHLPTHTDERNFHCESCGKSFRQLSTLSQHRAIHSDERPYSCEVCSKSFNRVSTLISHRKTHSDEKPYRCHLCPKGFHQKGNLRNHLFTHTNERPYRCNVCLKGFNQQSNLVCHKNKAHPDDTGPIIKEPCSSVSLTSESSKSSLVVDTKPSESADEVIIPDSYPSSSIESCSTPIWPKPLPDWGISPNPEPFPAPRDIWDKDAPSGSGVIVDPINTYHMQVAVKKKQTPFALLKSDAGAPVLVKVVDTSLPGGKQMLVPATADDLRDGGKIVVKHDKRTVKKCPIKKSSEAVQIRVPVVATVMPKIQPSGILQLIVEEPHHAFHVTMASELANVETSSNDKISPPSAPPALRPRNHHTCIENSIRPGGRLSSNCALPPPAPSPPLDLISLDLFDPMECMPMGPQITPVNHIKHPPTSEDDSDIFIGEFEDRIEVGVL